VQEGEILSGEERGQGSEGTKKGNEGQGVVNKGYQNGSGARKNLEADATDRSGQGTYAEEKEKPRQGWSGRGEPLFVKDPTNRLSEGLVKPQPSNEKERGEVVSYITGAKHLSITGRSRDLAGAQRGHTGPGLVSRL